MSYKGRVRINVVYLSWLSSDFGFSGIMSYVLLYSHVELMLSKINVV